MIGVIDHGAGNMRSVGNALQYLGIGCTVCEQPEHLSSVDRILIPGVGQFGAATRQLARSGMAEAIRHRALTGTPVLGICLGLQLLFANSEEAPEARGLGLLPGPTVRLPVDRNPHMGWNRVEIQQACPLLQEPDHFYFAHGYVAQLEADGMCFGITKIDGRAFPAVVGSGTTWGVQFHPEKSGIAGLSLLERFARC